ncbi:rna-directed dna polymerase from mobile element hypothetical protein [Limosa lapponica baueri]|uniref:Rna-directed dna polymerase from mobile element jockey-like n=1 Tax=Limosa lapponica baueri TaxID=1758121 RepID=A0A2I0UA58_LIMLA|nr:rna-directed dna polymerase from mobile element hypothetical protein [Limosa lapponica baueri]
MGNKQEELEATVLLERYDIVALTETWWDESYNWSVGIEGCKLFRRDRRGRRGGGVTLYVKEWIECEEMSPKPSPESDEEIVESLWLVEEPTRREALLDIVQTNKEGLVDDIQVGGNLGCSNHGKIEFRIVGSTHKPISRTETLDFRRANFDLFKKLLGEITSDKALEGQAQDPQNLEESEKVWTKEAFPLVKEDQVKEQLSELDTHKSMGPDRMHPRVLREPAEVVAEPLSIIFERSWRTGKVPEDWSQANVIPVFKKGKKEDLGNYRPVSLTSMSGKMMEQLVLGIISKHMEEKKAIRNNKVGEEERGGGGGCSRRWTRDSPAACGGDQGEAGCLPQHGGLHRNRYPHFSCGGSSAGVGRDALKDAAACGEPTQVEASGMTCGLRRRAYTGAGFLAGNVAHGESKLEQSVPEGLHLVERTHAGAVHEELQPVGRFHVGAVHEGL